MDAPAPAPNRTPKGYVDLPVEEANKDTRSGPETECLGETGVFCGAPVTMVRMVVECGTKYGYCAKCAPGALNGFWA